MKKLLMAATAAFVVTAGAGRADNTETVHWNTVGGWEIRTDPTAGCYMTSSFSTGQLFRLSYSRTGAFINISDPAWKSLTAGSYYPLTAQLDSGAPVSWSALAYSSPPFMGLAVSFDDAAKAFASFGGASIFKVWYNGNEIANLNLVGSTQAALETTRCNQAFTSRPTKADPFQPTAPQPAAKPDPFKGV